MTIKALYPTALPSLNLNFAKTKVLDPRVTFTRASTGTFVGSNGLIQTAASGAARFDHNPTTEESLGLLVEEARTNLLTYSEQFNDASWIKTYPPVNSNVFVAPDGTLTADEIIPESNGVYVSKGVTLTATIYSGSIYVRAGTATSFTFYLATSGLGLGASCIFNLSNGTASSVTHYGSSSNFTASIQALPDNWYRCSIAGSCTATTWYHQVGIFNNQSNNIYVWGAQLEAGAFPTSYIPTVASTVTRAADLASMTGTNFSSWYRQDEGTILGVCRNPLSGTQTYAGFDDATSSNQLNVYSDETTGYMTVVLAGSVVANLTLGTLSSANKNQFCGTYKLNSFAATLNSGSVLTDTSGAVPAITQLRIGRSQGGSSLFGTIARLTYYPVRLPDAQLQALTS